MSDDIATRLRNADDLIRTYIIDNDYLLELIAGSADEIERLRTQVAEWKDLASEYYHLDPKCECHLCDRFREAIRDAEQ